MSRLFSDIFTTRASSGLSSPDLAAVRPKFHIQ